MQGHLCHTETVLLRPALAVTAASLLATACVDPLPELDDAHRDLEAALPVFPGAEGFGTDTPAGRGGEVLRVTNLRADGEGSLRAAAEAEGPRVVVFEVSGTITIREDLRIEDPFLTIAGQTAPSPGITIAGAGLTISTHDVLVQHLRIRPGDDPLGPKPENRDAIQIIGEQRGELPVYNVVVDHCSLSWAVDEVGSTWYKGVSDVTWSNNIVSEGLWDSLHDEQPHSKGILIGDHSRRVAVLGNLFAHNEDRNPVIGMDASGLVAGNLVYDPGHFAIVLYKGKRCCPILGTIESNLVIPGVASWDDIPAVHLTDKVHDDTRVFAENNGPRQSDVGEQVWASERPVTVTPLTLTPTEAIEERVLAGAGARPLDRDPVDERVVQEVRDRKGGPVNSPADVGGYPILAENVRTFELPEDPNGDEDGDGYTNLEERLHDLAAPLEVPP